MPNAIHYLGRPRACTGTFRNRTFRRTTVQQRLSDGRTDGRVRRTPAPRITGRRACSKSEGRRRLLLLLPKRSHSVRNCRTERRISSLDDTLWSHGVIVGGRTRPQDTLTVRLQFLGFGTDCRRRPSTRRARCCCCCFCYCYCCCCWETAVRWWAHVAPATAVAHGRPESPSRIFAPTGAQPRVPFIAPRPTVRGRRTASPVSSAPTLT